MAPFLPRQGPVPGGAATAQTALQSALGARCPTCRGSADGALALLFVWTAARRPQPRGRPSSGRACAPAMSGSRGPPLQCRAPGDHPPDPAPSLFFFCLLPFPSPPPLPPPCLWKHFYLHHGRASDRWLVDHVGPHDWLFHPLCTCSAGSPCPRRPSCPLFHPHPPPPALLGQSLCTCSSGSPLPYCPCCPLFYPPPPSPACSGAWQGCSPGCGRGGAHQGHQRQHLCRVLAPVWVVGVQEAVGPARARVRGELRQGGSPQDGPAAAAASQRCKREEGRAGEHPPW